MAVAVLLIQACATVGDKRRPLDWSDGREIRQSKQETPKQKEKRFKAALRNNNARKYNTQFRYTKSGPCHQIDPETIALPSPVKCNTSNGGKGGDYEGGTVHVTQTIEFAKPEEEKKFLEEMEVSK
jgi:hypothetical protein